MQQIDDKLWFRSQRILISILRHPLKMIVILCVLSGLGWLNLHEHHPYSAHLWLILPLPLYFFLMSPVGIALAEKGITIWIPADTGQSTDAIVVLGRGPKLRDSRIQKALHLWELKRAPIIFVSGRNDALPIAQALEKEGIPTNRIAFDNLSKTTEENAQFTIKSFQGRSARSIILVTDPTHMLRASLTFQSLGFQVLPHMSDIKSQYNRTDAFTRNMREYAGLVTYALRGLFKPRHGSNSSEYLDDILSPPPDV